MRITSWNGLCGDVSRRLSDLAPLHADLITLQECRRPASDSASVIWRGFDTLPHQGVAVVSTEAARRLEFVEIPKLHPTIVPVRVQAPQPFVFVGVWTHPGLQHGGVGGNDGLRGRRGRSASGRGRRLQ